MPKRFTTLNAAVRSFTGVSADVDSAVSRLTEALVTIWTAVWLFTSVNPHVHLGIQSWITKNVKCEKRMHQILIICLDIIKLNKFTLNYYTLSEEGVLCIWEGYMNHL